MASSTLVRPPALSRPEVMLMNPCLADPPLPILTTLYDIHKDTGRQWREGVDDAAVRVFGRHIDLCVELYFTTSYFGQSIPEIRYEESYTIPKISIKNALIMIYTIRKKIKDDIDMNAPLQNLKTQERLREFMKNVWGDPNYRRDRDFYLRLTQNRAMNAACRVMIDKRAAEAHRLLVLQLRRKNRTIDQRIEALANADQGSMLALFATAVTGNFYQALAGGNKTTAEQKEFAVHAVQKINSLAVGLSNNALLRFSRSKYTFVFEKKLHKVPDMAQNLNILLELRKQLEPLKLRKTQTFCAQAHFWMMNHFKYTVERLLSGEKNLDAIADSRVKETWLYYITWGSFRIIMWVLKYVLLFLKNALLFPLSRAGAVAITAAVGWCEGELARLGAVMYIRPEDHSTLIFQEGAAWFGPKTYATFKENAWIGHLTRIGQTLHSYTIGAFANTFLTMEGLGGAPGKFLSFINIYQWPDRIKEAGVAIRDKFATRMGGLQHQYPLSTAAAFGLTAIAVSTLFDATLDILKSLFSSENTPKTTLWWRGWWWAKVTASVVVIGLHMQRGDIATVGDTVQYVIGAYGTRVAFNGVKGAISYFRGGGGEAGAAAGAGVAGAGAGGAVVKRSDTAYNSRAALIDREMKKIDELRVVKYDDNLLKLELKNTRLGISLSKMILELFCLPRRTQDPQMQYIKELQDLMRMKLALTADQIGFRVGLCNFLKLPLSAILKLGENPEIKQRWGQQYSAAMELTRAIVQGPRFRPPDALEKRAPPQTNYTFIVPINDIRVFVRVLRNSAHARQLHWVGVDFDSVVHESMDSAKANAIVKSLREGNDVATSRSLNEAMRRLPALTPAYAPSPGAGIGAVADPLSLEDASAASVLRHRRQAVQQRAAQASISYSVEELALLAMTAPYLDSLKRPQLVQLAKKHSIKANRKSAEIKRNLLALANAFRSGRSTIHSGAKVSKQIVFRVRAEEVMKDIIFGAEHAKRMQTLNDAENLMKSFFKLRF